MTPLWQSLGLNIGSLALFVWLWLRLDERLERFSEWSRNAVLGACMGIAGVTSIFSATEIVPGILFDLRSVPIALAGYLGGPIGGLLAAGLCGWYRHGLGGIAEGPALVGISFAALLGMFGHQLKGLAHVAIEAAILSVLSAALPFVSMALFTEIAQPITWGQLWLLASARGLGMFITLCVIFHAQRQHKERTLLRAALAQVPDYFYIKGRDLKFVAVNTNVATHHGFSDPVQLIGKTDRDLEGAERASKLSAAENELLANPGTPFGEEERLIDAKGIERWFETTKIALTEPGGQVAGLVGVTRDVTEARQLQRDLKEGRDLLSFLLEEMSVGLALFDRDGVLRYCNSKYRSAFPLTGDIRTPGTSLRHILDRVIATGEQLGIEASEAEQWRDQVLASLPLASDQHLPIINGTWVHVRTRPTVNGASLVVVSDVTSIKGPEQALLEMTDQLTKIATVDAMTGALTRRAFDGKFRNELLQSETSREPLSLLMIDVDHFKSFNDTYGHLAGDVCLGRIGHSLAKAVRDHDIVGRYGGEEFSVVLPSTDRAAALVVAERIASQLATLALVHAGSVTGHVTVSVGLASYAADEIGRGASELIQRADQALYESKASGRNCISVWGGMDRADVEWALQAS